MSFHNPIHCRLCAGKKTLNEVVDLSSNIDLRNEIINKLAIFPASTVDFTDHTLPETMCTMCCVSVRDCYDFFIKIRESQISFKHIDCEDRPLKSNVVKTETKTYKIKEEHLSDPFRQDSTDLVECNIIKTEFENVVENYCAEPKSIIYEDTITYSPPNLEADNPSENEPKLDESSEYEEDGFQCTSCDKSFATWKELQRHTSTDNDHIPKKRTKATIEERTCDICFKVFSIPAKLRYHKVKHTDRSRDYVCDVCGKAFYAKDSLNTHKIIHNPETQDCKICKKTFISMLRLRKHLKTHDVSKPFECDECHRRFRIKYQLARHMVVHSNVFPYSCDFCKKGFRFKNVLKTHENIHTGAKPFVCTVCDMDFTNWSNCNKHMVRKHGVSLAKRVKTARGMMPLNQETLKPKEVDMESVKWSELMCQPRKRGRKKLTEQSPT